MIPDFQTLMRPVLESASGGERNIADVVDELSDKFGLLPEERLELLPSGKQARMANRVHWARSYLKQAGLVRATGRGRFEITDSGREALKSGPDRITMKYLEKFPSYLEFQARSKIDNIADSEPVVALSEEQTPDEVLRSAYQSLKNSLSSELIERLRQGSPAFFERSVVELLLAMGYGATQEAGTVLGQSGDNGVDGVIDKDPLGVDQVYVQAKRYGDGVSVGAGEIRDFFGALSLKDVSRGIFVTTSVFSPSARQTAEKLGARIVLVDGPKLASLMIEYQIGCRVREVFRVSEVDEAYFE